MAVSAVVTACHQRKRPLTCPAGLPAPQSHQEHVLACWLDDQRMALALGELPPDQAARLHEITPLQHIMAAPPGPGSVRLFKALVRHMSGRPSELPSQPTWAQMAAEARAKIINKRRHIHEPGR